MSFLYELDSIVGLAYYQSIAGVTLNLSCSVSFPFFFCMPTSCAVQSFKIIDRMKIYTKYCNNYPAAEKLYKDKIKKKEFEAFIHVSITSTPMNTLFYHFLYSFNNMFSFLTMLYI